ncbi:hypothetical protein FHV95_102500 [Streptomyces coelicolor]|nr:hypothetical protein FHV91_102500 [Streptomyces coelicolor]TYP17349.1 hypothetical protein FHV98_1024 [Streptomyces coelicolor A3(2)]TYP20983.1 hypothetical protein FHV92_13478 [Streptomyces coelicolor]TYP22183.1 hypothetical protein FHV94_1304 [Streptomyces coelicolor]TYP58382.1 hypothetical protein FHV95_102500 [Streptomyces coelicolor]
MSASRTGSRTPPFLYQTSEASPSPSSPLISSTSPPSSSRSACAALKRKDEANADESAIRLSALTVGNMPSKTFGSICGRRASQILGSTTGPPNNFGSICGRRPSQILGTTTALPNNFGSIFGRRASKSPGAIFGRRTSQNPGSIFGRKDSRRAESTKLRCWNPERAACSEARPDPFDFHGSRPGSSINASILDTSPLTGRPYESSSINPRKPSSLSTVALRSTPSPRSKPSGSSVAVSAKSRPISVSAVKENSAKAPPCSAAPLTSSSRPWTPWTARTSGFKASKGRAQRRGETSFLTAEGRTEALINSAMAPRWRLSLTFRRSSDDSS